MLLNITLKATTIDMMRIAGLVMALCALALAACSGSEQSDFVPAGMTHSQPTFLYLFTEN